MNTFCSKIFGNNDLSIYERFATEWWDPSSPRFRSLQKITEFRLAQLIEWFGPVQGRTIVDIGCGGGLLAVPLIERGADVIGVDLSAGSLASATKAASGKGRFIVGNACSVPLPAESADFVLLADVLDHIPNYSQALAEARRLLKPGGLVYVSTINRTLRAWLWAIAIGEGSRLVPPGTHDVRLFIRPKELQTAAANADLCLLDLQGERAAIFSTLKNWAITFKAARSKAVAYSALLKVSGGENAS